jgi:hypothetical protein
VEVAFQSKFQLQPPYHGAYWMGLRIKKGAWNKTGFTPLDNAYATVYREPNASIYTAWATGEPNNARSNELCSVGNWTMRNGSVEAWGWQDAQCQQRLPAICKLAAPFDGETTNPCCGTKYTIHTKPVDAAHAEEQCRCGAGCPSLQACARAPARVVLLLLLLLLLPTPPTPPLPLLPPLPLPPLCYHRRCVCGLRRTGSGRCGGRGPAGARVLTCLWRAAQVRRRPPGLVQLL